MMKKVLVTGADGFIGRNLVNGLLAKNIEVYAVVYPGHNIYGINFEKRLHVLEIDLNEGLNYIEEFPNEIDVMYHLAWIGVQPEKRDDIDIQIKNIEVTMNCMKIANIKNYKKIICPGSTNEYLYYGKLINKYAVPCPNNAYGATKIALRYLCESFARKNKIDFVYTILTGVYAADRKDNNVIFYTIEKLLKKEKPLLTKLEQLWDYVYIDDVVGALIAVGQKGRNGEVYAIGHGDNWELKKYIEIIRNKIDPDLPLGIGEIPYNEERLPSSCIDLSQIETDTGFKPEIDFETGITKVIKKLKDEMEEKDER